MATKFAVIDSFDKKDLKDLFDLICTDIIKVDPIKVKTEKLGLTGKKKDIEEYSPGIDDVLNIITVYGIKFEFKVVYEEADKERKSKKEAHVEGGLPAPPPDIEEPKKDSLKEAMDDQKKEIDDVPEFELGD